MREKTSLRSFEELECWKASAEVRKLISTIIKTLPQSEKYDLMDNMKRASRSATRNIAEGYGRFHYKENIQFCRQSRGSLYELIDDLITCLDESYISQEIFSEGKAKIDKAINILNGYINYLNRAENQKTALANNQ